MKAYLCEDTDEEDCDDPIKLFDGIVADTSTAYFDSHHNGHSTRDTENRWEYKTSGSGVFCQKIPDNSSPRSAENILQTLQNGITSECDILPLFVKLVDCKKFPWYYKKYTQQIMSKVNLNQHGNCDRYVSDSDHVIDVEAIEDDSDDCVILNIQCISNKIMTKNRTCLNTVKSTGPKRKLQKHESFEVMKRHRDDREIQEALSVRNLIKVDLRRNQGLIGMKITQKIEANTTLGVKTNGDLVREADKKQKCVMADQEYLSSADKTLSYIGTQLIPLSEQRKNNSASIIKVNIESKELIGKPTLIKSSSSYNVPVKFDISKMSENLVNKLKKKKMNNQPSDPKFISNLSNESLLNNPDKINKSNKKVLTNVNEKELSSSVTIKENCSNSVTKLSSHVKDVKKTNKYKNDQLKMKNTASHSCSIGLLVTHKSKDSKKIKCTKRKSADDTQSTVAKLDKKPCKKIKKQEPNSPILHCSTVSKKPKHEIHPKCNKLDSTCSNLPKELGKLNQIVDKLNHLNSCNVVEDTNGPKHVILKESPVKKPFHVHKKETAQKVSCTVDDKTVSQVNNIHDESLNVSEKLSKNFIDVGKTTLKPNKCHNIENLLSPSKNKTLNEQNVFHESHQDNLNENKINSTSDPNRTPKANNKTVSNNNIPRASSVSYAIKSKSVPSTQYTNFPTTHRPYFPTHNVVSTIMKSGYMPYNSNNFPVRNRYASAIILPSNNHTNFPFENYHNPPGPVQKVTPQRSMTNLSDTQARPQVPQPPYPIFYPPAPSDRRQSFFQRLGNSVPNQFRPPHGPISRQPSNAMQDFYRDCWLSSPSQPPPPPPPPPPPLPPTDSLRNMPLKNDQDVYKSKESLNLNSPPASQIQNLQSASHQNSVNTLQHNENSSVIGVNNDGLVKKINIVATVTKNDNAVKEKQIKTPEIMSPLGEDLEVAATKTEMLKELDKLSFVDNNVNGFKKDDPSTIIINGNKTGNTLEMANMSKKPGKFETLKLTMNQKDRIIMQTKPPKGYSPPILPIPTYQKVLDKVTPNSQPQSVIHKIALCPVDARSNLKNGSKPMRIRDFVKCCKRRPNAWYNDEESRRKDYANKISLEEYKKRVLKNDCKPEFKKICKKKFNKGENQLNSDFKCKRNVDNGTETDLGYDSDSTVVL